MTWKDGIVAIFSPTISSAGSGVLGTGIPVGNDLILTARHVVRPHNRSGEPIRILHWFANVTGREAPKLDDEKLIVWESTTYDLALLHSPVPFDTTLFYLDPRKPRNGEPFSTFGFPTASSVSDRAEPGSYFGTVASAPDVQNYFEVQISADKQADFLEGWKGASGMPVMANEQVIGICIEAIPGAGKGTLRASPLWKVWRDDAKFRSFLQPKANLAGFEAKLAYAIEELYASETNRPLLQQVFTDSNLKLGRYPSTDYARNMARALMARPAKDVLQCLFPLQEKWQGPNLAAAPVTRFISIIGPVIFGLHANITVAAAASLDSGVAFLSEPPIGSETMAELLMAAAEQRPAEFMPRRHDDHYPVGQQSIPIEFEVGQDDAGGRLTFAILHELAGAAGHTRAPRSSGSFDQNIIASFLAETRGMPIDEYGFNAQMEVRRKRNRPLPYLVLYAPKNDYERTYVMSELRNLQNRIPLLNVIILTRDLFKHDIEKLEGFTFLLPKENAQ